MKKIQKPEKDTTLKQFFKQKLQCWVVQYIDEIA